MLAVEVEAGALAGGVAVGRPARDLVAVLAGAAELDQQQILGKRGGHPGAVRAVVQHPHCGQQQALHHHPAGVAARAGAHVAAGGVDDAGRGGELDRVEQADRPAQAPEHGREQRRGRRGPGQVPAQMEGAGAGFGRGPGHVDDQLVAPLVQLDGQADEPVVDADGVEEHHRPVDAVAEAGDAAAGQFGGGPDRLAQPGGHEGGAPALHLSQELLAKPHAHREAGLHVQGVLPGGSHRVQQELQVVGVEPRVGANP